MQRFRMVLITMTAAIAMTTASVVVTEGIDLVSPFLGAIATLSWQGQFNLDFACYLVLSGIWMAWRSGFTGKGIALGVLAPPLGILFLAPYLVYLIGQSRGDPRKLLLGVHDTAR